MKVDERLNKGITSVNIDDINFRSNKNYYFEKIEKTIKTYERKNT